MMGHLTGVATRIEEQPSVIKVHCLAHCLNLCLEKVSPNMKCFGCYNGTLHCLAHCLNLCLQSVEKVSPNMKCFGCYNGTLYKLKALKCKLSAQYSEDICTAFICNALAPRVVRVQTIAHV